MSGGTFTSGSVAVKDVNFNGGLNTAAGPLSVSDNESPDLYNVDFNTLGSVLKRSGYTALNTSAISGSMPSDGLWWYEYVATGAYASKFLNVTNGKLYKMDDLDGTWDDVTGAVVITAGSFCDFANFLNQVYITNGTNPPFYWTGSGNAAAMTVPTNLTSAAYVAQFQNYLFLANVVVGGTTHKSRFYWSTIKDTGTWDAAMFIDVSKDDGQEIRRMIVLGDRMVIFKDRAIYNVFFTGDPNIPFTVQKSNSPVGCVAPFSVQEVENGIVFLSYDGFYFYDGNNSFKISANIQPTIDSLNSSRLTQARSMRQKSKNRYFCSIPDGSQTENNIVLVWYWNLNAFSRYTGINAASMTSVYVSGVTERVYFGDYDGFVYRMDTGADDYPANVQTAISAYYYTNWKSFDDIVNQKGVPEVVLYFQIGNAVLTFAYSYDFESGDTYTQTFSLSSSDDVYGTAIYDESTYAGVGGALQRRALTSRGRVVRYKVANNALTQTFQIDGIGSWVHLETNV